MRWWPTVLGFVAGYLAIRMGLQAGVGAEEQWQLATRWTARVGFPFLIIAFAASSLARLWPSPLTGAILRDRRWWGLGFAAAHTAHLCSIINYFDALGEPIAPLALYGGGTAYVLMYAMALTSFSAAQRAMGAWWRRLHKTGIYVLGAVFTFSYILKAAGGMDLAFTMPYALIALGAFGLRFAAWRKRRAG